MALFLDQEAYRFRTDADAVDDTPTWGANENTTYYPGLDTNFRLRFAVANTGDKNTATRAWALQFRVDSGTWTTVTTSTASVQAANASSSASGAQVSVSRLTGTGSFSNGRYTETGTTANTGLGFGNYLEHEFGLTLLSADLSGGEVIDFRLLFDGGVLDAYSVTPVITVAGAGAQEVTPDTVGAATTVHEPAVVPGAVIATPDTVASDTAVHEPTLSAAYTLSPDTIAATTTVHTPVVAGGGTVVQPGTVAATTTVHDPAVAPGAVSVGPDTVAAATTVHEPVFAASATVAPDAIAATTVVHDPGIVSGAVAVLPDTIAAATVVHEPAVAGGAVVQPDTVAAATTVHEPVVFGGDYFLTQLHYRIRTDTELASGGTPTWAAAEDVSFSPAVDTTFRIRFLIHNSGGNHSGQAVWRLQYRVDAGTWTTVTTTSSFVRAADASTSANDTTILTAHYLLTPPGSGSPSDGRYSESGSVALNTIGAGIYKEFEYGLILRSADLDGGEVIDFRVIRTDEPLAVYAATPTMTVPGATLSPDTVSATTTVHEPTITTSVTLAPDTIAATTTVHEPTVSGGGAVLLPDTIAAVTVVHEPVVTALLQIAQPDTLAAATVVHEPTLTGGSLIVQPSTIAATTEVYNPAIVRAGDISFAATRALLAPSTAEVYIGLLTVTHEDFADDPVHLAANREDVVSNGITYSAFPMLIDMPIDDGGAARGTIRLSNVTKLIWDAVADLDSPPTVRLQVVLASAPDVVEFDIDLMELRQVSADAVAIEAQVGHEALVDEPWPSDRLHPTRAPWITLM